MEFFQKVMRTNEIKNQINEIKQWEEKIKREDLRFKTKNYTVIFNNMKRQDLLLKVFIMVKLIQMKLKWIKAIC